MEPQVFPGASNYGMVEKRNSNAKDDDEAQERELRYLARKVGLTVTEVKKLLAEHGIEVLPPPDKEKADWKKR